MLCMFSNTLLFWRTRVLDVCEDYSISGLAIDLFHVFLFNSH